MRKTVVLIFLYFAICLMIPYLITILMGGNCKGSKPDEIANAVVSTKDIESEITDVTDYTIRTVAAYYKAGDSAEFLKALAVVARTYSNITKGDGTGETSAAMVPDTFTYSKMREEWGDYYPAYYEAISSAVQDTEGIVMTMEQGELLPYFCELSAGYTRSIENSCLVMTGCSADLESKDYMSVVSYKQKEVADRISKKYSNFQYEDKISNSFQIISRDEAGYITSIMIGNLTMSGDEFAEIMDLNSGNFMISTDGDNITFTVKGVGAGYGMSLYTARQKAAAGAGYEEILYYFYKNIELTSE